ncbi:MAG: pyrroline-5-carboxylate reductase [Cyanobacteria bacterium QS_9_48_30]|nr:MAG: pyrroline-5-carboxylate reductase [Cyanobacteria bacterium QS_9_48_30]PSP07836.1 MAG: pyrroline-5-carboxylate reductase [Cyanobacteria bacterium SW_7_48_12]
MSIKFGMIGGGVMGEAILSRLLSQQVYAPDAVLVSDSSPQRRELLQQKYQVGITSDNRAAATADEVLLLAVKPQVLDVVVAELSGEAKGENKPLVISILAGVTLSRLESAFPEKPVIRAMPNTPATVGGGMSVIAPGSQVQPEQISQARTILEAVGQVVEVPEPLMDGVTGVSGSGPAYVTIMIEALADGGVAAGLPRAIAYQLAVQTVLGTAQLLQESGQHPAQLKDQVTSPGGTTIAAVAELERSGFRSAIAEAVQAAYQRSQELGK